MARWDVYIGTFTKEFNWLTGVPSEGIERFRFDDASGDMAHIETVGGVVSPQYLTLHPTLPIVLATEFATPGALVAFSVGSDGGLERRSTTDSLGDLATAVSVHPSGVRAYVANWGSGTLASYLLDEDGTVGPAEPVSQHREPDVGPMPRPDDTAHPHQILPNAQGNAVLVAYAGRHELVAYSADAEGRLSLLPVAHVAFPPASAPRHMQFHPSGRFVYVVGETGSSMYVVELDGGLPTRIVESYPTQPPGFDGTNLCSEVALHPDGRTLYVGNRGSDCITIFELDEAGATAAAVTHQPSIGRGPRGLTIDPTGNYLIVANTGSGDLVVFRIGQDRRLAPLGDPVGVPSPSRIVFARQRDTEQV